MLVATLVMLLLYLLNSFEPELRTYLGVRMAGHASPDTILPVLKLILEGLLAYLFVRALSVFIFEVVFRLRRGHRNSAMRGVIF